jgi:hypothetical protein
MSQHDLFGFSPPSQVLGSPRAKAPKADKDPVAKLMAQIASLEAELELLESELPAFQRKMQEALAPCLTQFEAHYRELIAFLGTEFAKPKASRKYKGQVSELAHAVAYKAHEVYGIDLEDALDSAKLGTEALGLDDDPEMLQFEQAFVGDLMDGLFRNMGVNPPEHIRKAMVEAAQKGEEPNAETQAWFEAQSINEPAAKSKKAKRTKRGHEQEALNPEALKKHLYHGLARDLHPDKASAEERMRRTALMQQLNAAYHEGNINALLKLLHAHGSEQMKAGVDPQAMLLLKKELEKQKFELRRQIRNIIDFLPHFGLDWGKLLTQPAMQQLLLQKEARSTQEEVLVLHNHVKQIQEPKELARFFKEVPSEYWEDSF